VFAKAHIYVKGVNLSQLKLALPSMSQLEYICCSILFALSNNKFCQILAIFPLPFLAEKWPTTVETGWKWVKPH